MGKVKTKAVPEMPGFVTEAVLAGRIGVTEKSMWRKRRNGSGPVPTIIGRQIFYSDADIAEWVARCRQVKPAPRTRRVKILGDFHSGGRARDVRLDIASATAPLSVSATVAETAATEVRIVNIENVDVETFLIELSVTNMAAADLLRDDPELRKEFSGPVELADFMAWQAKRLLISANLEEANV